VIAAVVALPTVAQAEYNGPYYLGCTYSWGSACYSPYQHAESVRAMDPDNAYYSYPGQATNNGYPKPKLDGIERTVCASLWANPNVTISYNWVCANGAAVAYPHNWGYPGLGGGNYQSIALYEHTN
jgi:hypothetical protein